MRWLWVLLLAVVPARAGSIHLPGLTIHKGHRPCVEATGAVCLTNGILEFVAVEAKGREYESLLTLDCRPSQLQCALLLIGCETGAASRVSLEVEHQNRRVPVEQWLRDRRTGQPPRDLDWIFTGSYCTTGLDGRRVFLADEEQAFIALWPQSSVPINLVGEHGNPYRGEQQGFEVNTAAVPPVGTKIKLILRPRPR